MATYNNTKKTYYTIAFGKLKRYEGDGVSSEFTGIDGIFTGITQRSRDINGEKKTFIDFNFVDGGEVFCVSCEKFSNNGNAIISCLANITDFSKKVLIETWQTNKDGRSYTNVSVKQDGQRVSWLELPKPESFTIQTGETVKSTKKRDAFVEELILKVNAAVNGGAPAEKAPERGPEPQYDGPIGPQGEHAGEPFLPPEYAPTSEPYIPPHYIPNDGE